MNILAADADLYMAGIDDKIIMKIGPKMDLGNLLPQNYQVATSGKDYAVWEKKWFAVTVTSDVMVTGIIVCCLVPNLHDQP